MKFLEANKKNLEGKVVCYYCDDENTNYVEYLSHNFKEFQLKKLIVIFNEKNPIKLTIKPTEKSVEFLKGNGKFSSPECVKILKECDYVVRELKTPRELLEAM